MTPGMFGSSGSLTFFLIIAMAFAAVVGWAVIEGIVWLFHHIHLTFGWG